MQTLLGGTERPCRHGAVRTLYIAAYSVVKSRKLEQLHLLSIID